jgi:hypothetical protein
LLDSQEVVWGGEVVGSTLERLVVRLGLDSDVFLQIKQVLMQVLNDAVLTRDAIICSLHFSLFSLLVLLECVFDDLEEVSDLLVFKHLSLKQLLVELVEEELSLHFIGVNHLHQESPCFFQIEHTVSDSSVVSYQQLKYPIECIWCSLEVFYLVLVRANFLPYFLSPDLPLLLILVPYQVVHCTVNKVLVVPLHASPIH